MLLLICLSDYVKTIISNQQFEFRHKHDTTRKCYRLVQDILHASEQKKYFSMAFLDISYSTTYLGANYPIEVVIIQYARVSNDFSGPTQQSMFH